MLTLMFLFPCEYKNDKLKEVYFNKNNNIIINTTNVKSLDTIYYKGLELLGINNELFVIYELTPEIKSGFPNPSSIIGSVTKIDDYYLIFTKLTDNITMIDIASHELIHVDQFIKNKFEVMDDKVRWENELFDLPLKIKYEDAPWEIDAYKKAKPFNKLMYEVLLIKK